MDAGDDTPEAGAGAGAGAGDGTSAGAGSARNAENPENCGNNEATVGTTGDSQLEDRVAIFENEVDELDAFLFGEGGFSLEDGETFQFSSLFG